MSVSCPRSRPPAQEARGFTLLELLIVLALVSMVAAMVVPRLQGTYDAVARSGDRAEALRQVERLPLIARDRGRAIVIPAGDPAALAQLLSLPGGWQASAVEPGARSRDREVSGFPNPMISNMVNGLSQVA